MRSFMNHLNVLPPFPKEQVLAVIFGGSRNQQQGDQAHHMKLRILSLVCSRAGKRRD